MALDHPRRLRLLLRNARILTMDGRSVFPGSVEIAGGRIAAVLLGIDHWTAESTDIETIDCGGRLLLPGFIDAHIHILAAAAALASLDCSSAVAPSIEAILQRLREAARDVPAGAWLQARGYHEAALAEARPPTRRDLDRAVGEHPVRLVHASGHASVLNSAALRAVGIDANSEEPPGASIDREAETGEPSGLLIEMEDWLDRRTPHAGTDRMPELIQRLSDRLLAAGVTSVQDMGHRNDGARARFLADLVAEGRFRPRLALASGYEAFAAGDPAVAPGIAMGPVKIVLNEIGDQLSPSPARLSEMVLAVHRPGRQVAIHAIEPRAIEAALDAIEAAVRQHPRRGHRHRIEHAAVTPPRLAARIAALGVTAVSNPSFLWERGERYRRTVPAAELPWLYDAARLRRAGVTVAAGTDAPVAAPEPLLGIAAACTRRSREGLALPGETLPFEAAAELFTSAAAWAGLQEDQVGQIACGRLADLVLLDGDLSNPVSLGVVMTVLGGEALWRTSPPAPPRAGRGDAQPVNRERE